MIKGEYNIFLGVGISFFLELTIKANGGLWVGTYKGSDKTDPCRRAVEEKSAECLIGEFRF